MKIHNVISKYFLLLLLAVTFQVQAGVQLSFDAESAAAGGTTSVLLKIAADGSSLGATLNTRYLFVSSFYV